MVSSTAIPKQIANERALAMPSDSLIINRRAPAAASGIRFGRMDTRPIRIERKAIANVAKITIDASAKLRINSTIT